jgi:hypothetical protein
MTHPAQPVTVAQWLAPQDYGGRVACPVNRGISV